MHRSLTAELRESHPEIRTVLVTPGQVSTPLFYGVQTPNSFIAPVVEPVDVAKEIVAAIEEGRRIFDNIQKFILHVLAENIAQAGTLLVGLAFKDSRGLSVFPLAPVEIIWIIMVTSGMPDMGLGFERAVPDIMSRPPQNLDVGIFDKEFLVQGLHDLLV